MKALLLTILVVILIIFGYNKYADYQRFSLENYRYEPQFVAQQGTDATTLLLYHQKIEALNGHVITQWSANDLDVRNPEDDDQATLAARATYDKILGEIKALENQLENGNKKQKGNPSKEAQQQKHDRIKELFATTPNNDLRIGSRGALVYELQKLLNANGSDIPEDGNFQNVTFEALKNFESQKNLFPDGKLDMLTLEYLLSE